MAVKDAFRSAPRHRLFNRVYSFQPLKVIKFKKVKLFLLAKDKASCSDSSGDFQTNSYRRGVHMGNVF